MLKIGPSMLRNKIEPKNWVICFISFLLLFLRHPLLSAGRTRVSKQKCKNKIKTWTSFNTGKGKTWTSFLTLQHIYIYIIVFKMLLCWVRVPFLKVHGGSNGPLLRETFFAQKWQKLVSRLCLVHFEDPKTASSHFWPRTVRGVTTVSLCCAA